MGVDWGYYAKENGDCAKCTRFCETDETCEAVECGEGYCRWRSNNKCNAYHNLTSINLGALHTCIKMDNVQGKSLGVIYNILLLKPNLCFLEYLTF